MREHCERCADVRIANTHKTYENLEKFFAATKRMPATKKIDSLLKKKKIKIRE